MRGAVIGVEANGFAETVGGFSEMFAGTQDVAQVEVGLVDAAFAAGNGCAMDFFGFDEATLFCQQTAKENAEVCVVGSRCDSPSMPFGCLFKVASLAEQMPHLRERVLSLIGRTELNRLSDRLLGFFVASNFDQRDTNHHPCRAVLGEIMQVTPTIANGKRGVGAMV